MRRSSLFIWFIALTSFDMVFNVQFFNESENLCTTSGTNCGTDLAGSWHCYHSTVLQNGCWSHQGKSHFVVQSWRGDTRCSCLSHLPQVSRDDAWTKALMTSEKNGSSITSITTQQDASNIQDSMGMGQYQVDQNMNDILRLKYQALTPLLKTLCCLLNTVLPTFRCRRGAIIHQMQ